MKRREFMQNSAALGAVAALAPLRAAEPPASRKSIGIDVGIPTGKSSRQASPDDTYAAVTAALKAGAAGVILSRKYSEMRLANLAAAGRAARDATRG